MYKTIICCCFAAAVANAAESHTVSNRSCVSYKDVLSAKEAVRSLRIENCTEQIDLSNFSQLEELYISGVDYRNIKNVPASLKSLHIAKADNVQIESCSNLQELSLDECQGAITVSCNVKKLSLKKCDLAQIQYNKENLESLHLEEVDNVEKYFQKNVATDQYPKLTSFAVNDCNGEIYVPANITQLYINNCNYNAIKHNGANLLQLNLGWMEDLNIQAATYPKLKSLSIGESTGNVELPKRLAELYVDDCHNIQLGKMPESIQKISIVDSTCRGLMTIDLSTLKNLTDFMLHGTEKIYFNGDFAPSINVIDVLNCDFSTSLDISQLHSLQHLVISNASRIVFGNNPALQTVSVFDSTNLVFQNMIPMSVKNVQLHNVLFHGKEYVLDLRKHRNIVSVNTPNCKNLTVLADPLCMDQD